MLVNVVFPLLAGGYVNPLEKSRAGCAATGCSQWTCVEWCLCFDEVDETAYTAVGCVDDGAECSCEKVEDVYTVDGGYGGWRHNDDQGGVKSNGYFVDTGRTRSGKPVYRNENGMEMWYEVPNDVAGSWGARNLNNNKASWHIGGIGHHRYWVDATSALPQVSTDTAIWHSRLHLASGDLRVRAGIHDDVTLTNTLTFTCSGAVSNEAKVHDWIKGQGLSNGLYTSDPTKNYKVMHNGKRSFIDADGFVIMYESAAKKEWGAMNMCGGRDCWTVTGTKGNVRHHRWYAVTDSELPPMSGWKARYTFAFGEFSCKAGDHTGIVPIAVPSAARKVTVDGSLQGVVNGVYVEKTTTYNGKPQFQHGAYNLRWEKAGTSDWGAKNLGGNKDIWTVTGEGHHRFWVESSDDLPPMGAAWRLRPAGLGTGVLRVRMGEQAVAPSPPKQLMVTGGCGGLRHNNDQGGLKSNGLYTQIQHGEFNQRAMWKNDNGYIIKFELLSKNDWGARRWKGDGWTIAGDGHHRYWVGDDGLNDYPPTNEMSLRTNLVGSTCTPTIKLV